MNKPAVNRSPSSFAARPHMDYAKMNRKQRDCYISALRDILDAIKWEQGRTDADWTGAIGAIETELYVKQGGF